MLFTNLQKYDLLKIILFHYKLLNLDKFYCIIILYDTSKL